jgi:hypothetical protein
MIGKIELKNSTCPVSQDTFWPKTIPDIPIPYREGLI